MKLTQKNAIPLILIIICLIFGGWVAFAESGGGSYEITRFTIEPGNAAANGTLSLKSTSGQPDAAFSENGSYTLLGGFWGGQMGGFDILLPVILRP